AAHAPFMAKFVLFGKRVSLFESRIRVFCMTDDKEDKTLEHQEHFVEIAKSRDVEVLENKDIFMEFAGNLVPVLQSGEQPKLGFKAFKENRSAFTMRLRDPDEEPVGRIIFMSDSKVAKGEPTQIPLCTLNLVLPKDILPDRDSQSDLLSLDIDNSFLHHGGISKPDTIHRADFRLSDICNLLDEDWVKLASELDIAPSDIALIKEEYPNNNPQQAMIMFRLWLRQKANKATDDFQNQNSTDKDLTDTISDYLLVKKDQKSGKSIENQLDNRAVSPNANQEVLEEITQQLNNLQSTPRLKIDKNANTPPPSPAEFHFDKEANFVNQVYLTKGTSSPQEEILTSTPLKSGKDSVDIIIDPIAILKKNVNDTLTFLHQERNDFLPQEDIIIPSRKDDHISKDIDLSSINLRSQKKTTDELKTAAENEVNDVIQEAENVVNDLKSDVENGISIVNDEIKGKVEKIKDAVEEKTDSFRETGDSLLDEYKNTTEDSLDNLESLKDDSISNAQEKSEEAFRFLENEISSPLTPLKDNLRDTATFVQREIDSILYDEPIKIVNFSQEIEPPNSPKSSIPVAKPRQKIEKEKDIDLLFSYDGRESVSPTDEDLLSKIPIKGGKVKTIKKHSKDPLKEFVKLSQDVNWDDSEENITEKIVKNVTADPIIRTTSTRITTETVPEKIKSKIPVLHTETLSPTEITERYEISPRSKIPILKTETTRITSPETTYVERTIISPTQVIETTVVSPGSKISTKSSTIDSDSDDDSPRTPPLKGILKKTSIRTVGSSSGSDVALHEEGAELSESETEDLYHQDQPQYTETVAEEIDPITGAKITRTVRTVSQIVTSPGGRSEEEMRQSMQNVLDQFMSEERIPH
ncbi:Death and/or Prominin domain containing protein, partial [Asbolus verrucosus]